MGDVAALVLAAGTATRFGVEKQFLEIAPSVRLVDLAVDKAWAVAQEVVLVLPNGRTWDRRSVSTWTTGGDSRLVSVRRALQKLTSKSNIVLIHDAAHPLAPLSLFDDLITAVSNGADAAVPYLPLGDVVKARHEQSGMLRTVGRDGWGLAQVPMAFAADALFRAHRSHNGRHIWEDSMLVEAMGGQVVAVDGMSSNVHVVTPEDLDMARTLYQSGFGRLI